MSPKYNKADQQGKQLAAGTVHTAITGGPHHMTLIPLIPPSNATLLYILCLPSSCTTSPMPFLPPLLDVLHAGFLSDPLLLPFPALTPCPQLSTLHPVTLR